MKFRGMLFDLDGTLVDSLKAVDRAWRTWAKRNDIEPEAVFKVIHGRPARDSVVELLDGATEAKIDEETLWLERYESEDTEGTIALPGAIALLQRLNQLNVPWAIVTSGTNPVATARVKSVGLPEPEVLVTPELVSRGKPDPEPYLLGAKKLGLLPQDCLVFEDAPAGVKSGDAAGMRVLALTTHFRPEQLPEADLFIDSLEKLSVAAVANGYQLSVS